MNTSDKIITLQKEIINLQNQMKNCNHVWDETKYDPEKIPVGYGSIQDGGGSDPHWSFAGYNYEEVPRWSRTCSICGYTEYNYH